MFVYAYFVTWTVHTGDCLEVMATLPANSVDAVVTDPPYGLAFMGKAWDHAVPGPEFFAAMLRVAKPGAHIVSFGGTRLYHRMTCAMEDAGWEIRDCLMWLYGSGFPKSHDVSKAIDKANGSNGHRGPMKRGGERLARLEDGTRDGEGRWGDEVGRDPYTYVADTDEAKRWQGWGTALKPAWEPIVLARKPLDGTVAENHLRHGCGGLNVDGCRVGTEGGTRKGTFPNESSVSCYGNGLNGACEIEDIGKGRWPANLILDGDLDLPEWSRFFYCPKASKADRDEGLEESHAAMRNDGRATDIDNPYQRGKVMKNHHPTVKPTDLMRWLCRLVTPTGGTVLDPFTGSGSTGKAARLEGFNFIGIEREPEYADIARARIASASVPMFA